MFEEGKRKLPSEQSDSPPFNEYLNSNCNQPPPFNERLNSNCNKPLSNEQFVPDCNLSLPFNEKLNSNGSKRPSLTLENRQIRITCVLCVDAFSCAFSLKKKKIKEMTDEMKNVFIYLLCPIIH